MQHAQDAEIKKLIESSLNSLRNQLKIVDGRLAKAVEKSKAINND